METIKTYRAPHPTQSSGSHSRPCALQGQSSSAQGSASSSPLPAPSPPNPSPPQSASSSARARPLPFERPPWASSICLDLARQRQPWKRRAPVCGCRSTRRDKEGNKEGRTVRGAAAGAHAVLSAHGADAVHRVSGTWSFVRAGTDGAGIRRVDVSVAVRRYEIAKTH